MISIILPIYSEADSTEEICKRIAEKTKDETSKVEVILVNDGNIRNVVYQALERLKKWNFVKVIHLSRNFGQHIAIAAGMKNARGDYILIMDSDLQYDPIECLEMAKMAEKEAHPVVLSTHNRSLHPFFQKITSKIYYMLIQTILGLPYPSNLGSAFVVSKEIARGLLSMGDRYRMTIPMAYWLYGDIHYHEIKHFPRMNGKSGYTLSKKIRHALYGSVSFSTAPLTFVLFLGANCAFLSLILGVIFLIMHFFTDLNFLSGWLSTMLTLLFSSGLILFCLGIVGTYIGRIFDSTTARPLYFVQKGSNSEIKLFEE